MKFYEYIFNNFKVIEQTRLLRSWYLKRDVTKKVSIQELWVLRSACHLMLVNICMKFHEDIQNSFKVTERTRFCLRNCYLQSSKGHK